jgi:hypothetical protein
MSNVPTWAAELITTDKPGLDEYHRDFRQAIS